MALESLFPLAPRPQEGELLSSWVGRLACRYALDVQDLLGWLSPLEAGGAMSREIIPMDYRAPADLLTRLAAAARIPVARLEALQLVEAYPHVPPQWFSWQWPDFSRGTGTILGPLAIEPAYCPACLREDMRSHRQVFLRAEWALACTTICPKHDQPLVRLCGQCMRPRPIGHSALDEGSRLICRKCSRDLDEYPCPYPEDVWRGELTAAAQPAIAALEADIRAALGGASPSPRWFGETNAAMFLSIIEIFCAVLTRGRRSMGRGALLEEFLPAASCFRNMWSEQNDYPFWFAHLGVERRHRLFTAIVEITAADTPWQAYTHAQLNPGHDLAWLWSRLFEAERHLLMDLAQTGPRDLAARIRTAAEKWSVEHATRHHCREEEGRLQARLRRLTEIDAAKSALRGAFDIGQRISIDRVGHRHISISGADEAAVALINRHSHWTRSLALKLVAGSGRDVPLPFERLSEAPPPGLPLALPGADDYRDMARAILKGSGGRAIEGHRSGANSTLRRRIREVAARLESDDRPRRQRSRHKSPGQIASDAGTEMSNG